MSEELRGRIAEIMDEACREAMHDNVSERRTVESILRANADRILALLPTEGEPVAWRYRWRDKAGWHYVTKWSAIPPVLAHPPEDPVGEVVPLYATPQESAPGTIWHWCLRDGWKRYPQLACSYCGSKGPNIHAITVDDERPTWTPQKSAEVERLRERLEGAIQKAASEHFGDVAESIDAELFAAVRTSGPRSQASAIYGAEMTFECPSEIPVDFHFHARAALNTETDG